MTEAIDEIKPIVRFFWPLFCAEPKVFKTADWKAVDIFDTPTQIMLFNSSKTAIYGRISEELESVVYKIMKENKLDVIPVDNIELSHITEFRKQFWKYPEVTLKLESLLKDVNSESEIDILNRFFEEMARNAIYNDEDLVKLREFRVYIARKTISFDAEIGSDLYNDLYYFLDFGRFSIDDYVIGKAKETLNRICQKINAWECPDMRKFHTFKDRDSVPLDVLSSIEKLVLLNYCDKPDKKVVKEVRDVVESMDLDILKEYLWFIPKEWQKYALIFESRENLAANCRRSWKSFLTVYIAIRQIFLPWQMILYILPIKEDYSEQPFFYIEGMIENIKKKWVELEWFQFNSKLFRCINKWFKSKIIFLSAQWSSKWKSFSANLVIIDEAAYIDDWNIYDQASNSTSDTMWRMWAISTINIDTPINRFFFKKISLDWMEDSKVLSIDIWNNPFMSDAEKKRTELKYKDRNPKVWLADWMWIFVWAAEWFDISVFFKMDFNYDVIWFKWNRFNLIRNLDKYQRFMISYDPAKNMDKAWIAVIWLLWHKAEVIMTWYINIKNYFLQWDVVLEMFDYLKNIRPTELAVDLWKAWEAAFDYFEARKTSPYWLLSTWWNTVNKITFRRWNVPASEQEKNLHSLMAAGLVTWYSRLDNIRNEFETYNLSKERKWNVGHHHDIVSALMMAVFFWYERKLIQFDRKELLKKIDITELDANWLPIRKIPKWVFSWDRQSRFLY